MPLHTRPHPGPHTPPGPIPGTHTTAHARAQAPTSGNATHTPHASHTPHTPLTVRHSNQHIPPPYKSATKMNFVRPTRKQWAGRGVLPTENLVRRLSTHVPFGGRHRAPRVRRRTRCHRQVYPPRRRASYATWPASGSQVQRPSSKDEDASFTTPGVFRNTTQTRCFFPGARHQPRCPWPKRLLGRVSAEAENLVRRPQIVSPKIIFVADLYTGIYSHPPTPVPVRRAWVRRGLECGGRWAGGGEGIRVGRRGAREV